MSASVLRLQDWSTFASSQVSAAATLIGLVFVAVSINLKTITSGPGLTARAAESLLQFFQVFLIAAWILVPGLSVHAFAIHCLTVGAVSWLAQTIGILKFRPPPGVVNAFAITLRTLFVQCSTIPFCVAGSLLLAQKPGAPMWLVPGFLISFAAGIFNAWVLLVEIVR